MANKTKDFIRKVVMEAWEKITAQEEPYYLYLKGIINNKSYDCVARTYNNYRGSVLGYTRLFMDQTKYS